MNNTARQRNAYRGQNNFHGQQFAPNGRFATGFRKNGSPQNGRGPSSGNNRWQPNRNNRPGLRNNAQPYRPGPIMFVPPKDHQHSMLVLVAAKTCEHDISCLFDTGASCPIIDKQLSERLLKSNVIKLDDRASSLTKQLQGANGTKLNVGRAVIVNFELQNEIFSCTCIPVENVQTSMLLGPDFMHKEEVIIDMRPTRNVVRITKRNLELPFRTTFQPLTQRPICRSVLFVKRDPQVINPFETKYVPVEHTHNDPNALATRIGYLTNRPHTQITTPLRVTPGIVKFENGEAPDISYKPRRKINFSGWCECHCGGSTNRSK